MSTPHPAPERIAGVLNRFQSAAMGRASWHDALAVLTDLFGGPAAQLFMPSLPGGCTVCGTDDTWVKAYVEYYYARNPVLPPSMRLPAGTAVADWGVVDRRAFERSDFYNEFIMPQGISHGGIYVLEAADGISPPTLLKVDRPHAAGPYGPAELRLLATLGESFRDALAASAHLARLEAERDSLAAGIDRLATGIVFLCPRGRIVHANAAAEALLAARDGVARTRSGELTAAAAGDVGPLDRALAGVLRPARGAHAATGRLAALRVTRRRAEIASQLSVYALSLARDDGVSAGPTAAGAPPGAAVAMVLLVPAADDGDGPPLSLSELSRMFGLTAAQARVAAGAARGLRPAALARALGLGEATVRTHLLEIYRRVEVDGQAGLRAILARIPVRFGSEAPKASQRPPHAADAWEETASGASSPHTRPNTQ